MCWLCNDTKKVDIVVQYNTYFGKEEFRHHMNPEECPKCNKQPYDFRHLPQTDYLEELR